MTYTAAAQEEALKLLVLIAQLERAYPELRTRPLEPNRSDYDVQLSLYSYCQSLKALQQFCAPSGA